MLRGTNRDEGIYLHRNTNLAKRSDVGTLDDTRKITNGGEHEVCNTDIYPQTKQLLSCIGPVKTVQAICTECPGLSSAERARNRKREREKGGEGERKNGCQRRNSPITLTSRSLLCVRQTTHCYQ